MQHALRSAANEHCTIPYLLSASHGMQASKCAFIMLMSIPSQFPGHGSPTIALLGDADRASGVGFKQLCPR